MREAVALRNYHGSIRSAASKSGIPRQTLQSRLKQAAARGLDGNVPAGAVAEGFEIHRRSARYDKAGNLVAQSVSSKPEPGGVFQPRAGHVIKGESALLDPEGRTLARWVKTREGQSPEDTLAAIREVLEGAASFATLPPAPTAVNADLLAFFPIADIHLGALAHHDEAGDDYDLKIAESILKTSIGELISRSAPAETALILDLGDFLHADNSMARTAKSGNALDVDSRHSKVVKTGFLAMVWIIELALQKHSRVIYRKLSGNHDEETSGTFALGLWAYFRSNPRVEIDISPSRMFVHQFGSVLLAGTHGDMLRMDGLAGWVAATHPKPWGDTRFRYGWTGHIHNKTAITSPGITVESLNSPAAKDAWHAQMGYTAPRNMISVTYHKDKGEMDRLTVAVVR
ncbi:hypothetical protein LB518_22655 [Mesorhizobium sp. BR1-1-16]|uniref:hypothetical protein n=1 Tax=Mesorhizobium sp. BR1-1-16 TaxID=2876653 RepID=UPI001CCD8865|nr:hypothetical protein [Mesorhizobium sp. BR1-1-16]MBZ9939115.1 hypothetical protein [Mesorhizobium sp. BR1-1-16]